MDGVEPRGGREAHMCMNMCMFACTHTSCDTQACCKVCFRFVDPYMAVPVLFPVLQLFWDPSVKRSLWVLLISQDKQP